MNLRTNLRKADFLEAPELLCPPWGGLHRCLPPHNNTDAGTLHEEVPLFTQRRMLISLNLSSFLSLSPPQQAGLECDGLS